MKLWTILATALLMIAAQFATSAEARDQFNQQDAVRVDPQTSYIFFRTRERTQLRFLREVSAQQRAEWIADREAALARAQERYERQASQYRRAVEACRDVAPPCVSMERPSPVTSENFAFPPPELGNFVSVTRGPQFSRTGEGDYTYLVAVPPGTGAAPAEVIPYAATMSRPDRLNGLPVVAAERRAGDKMPNYFGVLISRHPALPGVLRYERDRVIDDRTGAAPVPLASPDTH